MNDAPVVPAVTPEPKAPVVPKKKAAMKPAARRKAVAKKSTKKVTKPVAKKPRKRLAKKAVRRPFPYLRVLKLWKQGKTLETIARATGRYQKDAADPLHSFRVTLTRFHKGVKLNGRLLKLPHRISRKALKLATRAGKKAAA
jgi:hypothetical protein